MPGRDAPGRLPRAAVFDLDGVIADTATLHFAAWRALAERLGFELAREHEPQLRGVDRMTALGIVLGVGGLRPSRAEARALAGWKNARYVELLEGITSSDALPGARELIGALRGRGVPVALASASRNAHDVVARLGLARVFDAVVDGRAARTPKPDPEALLLAARSLRVEPSDCVVFEDAHAGVVAAHACGMTAVGVGDPTTLAAADLVVRSLEHVDVGMFAAAS